MALEEAIEGYSVCSFCIQPGLNVITGFKHCKQPINIMLLVTSYRNNFLDSFVKLFSSQIVINDNCPYILQYRVRFI